jgi:hypothetical protein
VNKSQHPQQGRAGGVSWYSGRLSIAVEGHSSWPRRKPALLSDGSQIDAMQESSAAGGRSREAGRRRCASRCSGRLRSEPFEIQRGEKGEELAVEFLTHSGDLRVAQAGEL